jgi:hypothetical protein
LVAMRSDGLAEFFQFFEVRHKKRVRSGTRMRSGFLPSHFAEASWDESQE